MRPHWRARMPGITAWVQRKTDFRLTAMVRSKSASVSVVDAAHQADAGIVHQHVDRPQRALDARPSSAPPRRPGTHRRAPRPPCRPWPGSPARRPPPRPLSRDNLQQPPRPLRPAKRRWPGRSRASRRSPRPRVSPNRSFTAPDIDRAVDHVTPHPRFPGRLTWPGSVSARSSPPIIPSAKTRCCSSGATSRFVKHLDELGYDEFWCGEHHSSGWEMIASPEMFLAAAGEHTKRIKLATGVISLPYHNPFNVAQRMVQLDWMTGGRAIFGSGPGALPSDAYTLGIDPMTQRDRQDEAIDIIRRLFRGERVTQKSDWYTLQDAAPAAPAAAGGDAVRRRLADQPVGHDARPASTASASSRSARCRARA